MAAGALVSREKEKLVEAIPRLPTASATRAEMPYLVPVVVGRAVVGVNAQVSVALSTVARPRREEPLEMRRLSPLVRGAEMVPLKDGVVSSVKALAARLL